MTNAAAVPTPQLIDGVEWPEIELPPTDLPYDDGDKMESPWHFKSATLLMAGCIAARGGQKFAIVPSKNCDIFIVMVLRVRLPSAIIQSCCARACRPRRRPGPPGEQLPRQEAR